MSKQLLLGALASVVLGGAASAAVIPNGDFSAGQTGFTSSYTPEAYASDTLVPEGTYTVGPNPQLVNSNWINQTGTNNLLLVNGSTNPSQTFVYTSNAASLDAGSYVLSADAANVCCNGSFTGPNSPSTLTFTYSVDGGTSFNSFAPAATYTTASDLSDTGLKFSHLNFAFNTTAATTGFEVRITNATDAASGNDFALDNLSVAAVSAAPEPGTWMLMLGGIGFLGLALRAARQRAAGVLAA